MKKLIATLALTVFLGGCAGTGLTDAQSTFLREAAINRIAAFNAAGVQILELDPVQLLALDTACFAATAVATFRTPDMEASTLPRAVENTCLVLAKLAAGDPVTPEFLAELQAKADEEERLEALQAEIDAVGEPEVVVEAPAELVEPVVIETAP